MDKITINFNDLSSISNSSEGVGEKITITADDIALDQQQATSTESGGTDWIGDIASEGIERAVQYYDATGSATSDNMPQMDAPEFDASENINAGGEGIVDGVFGFLGELFG